MLLGVAVLCGNASAQEPRVNESIEVSIVNVEVHVTDKHGNRVTGLRPEDFEVVEDGKVQPITNFSEYTPSGSAGTVSVRGVAPQPETTTSNAATEAPPRARRSIVLFLEPITLANFRAKELFDSIRTLLRRTVAEGDQVCIITFVRAVRIRQPFTDDMTSIEKTLDTLEKDMTGVEGTSNEQSKFILAEAASFEKEYEEALASMGMSATNVNVAASMGALAAARHERFLIRQKAFALESLIESISGADGRKILIMATRRFGLYAGAQYFGGTVPNAYKQELDTTQYRQALIRTANAHGVTIYPVHPEGLRWTVDNDPSVSGNDWTDSLAGDLSRTSFDNSVLMNESGSLQQMADATGGVTAWGSTNIARILPGVGDDLESYYSLGYRATATGKDEARNVAVKTKNRDYVVRSRQQFVEKSETTKLEDRVVANLFQPVEGSSASIPFDVALGAMTKKGRNRWSVPLKITIPIRSLTTLPDGKGESGAFSVFFVTGGVLGVMSDVEHQTRKFEIAQADLTRAQSSHFTYELTLEFDRLVQLLSIAVMDDVGKEYGLARLPLPKRE